MSARLYDYIITVSDASKFRNGNNIIGLSSGTVGYIANVDTTTNNIKVKVNNAFQEFSSSERVISKHYLISNVLSIQSNVNSNANNLFFTVVGSTIPTANGEYGNTVIFQANANGNLFWVSNVAWGSGYTSPPTSELSIYVNNVYAQPETWKFHRSNNTIEFSTYAKPGLANVIIRRETGNIYSQSFVASNLSIGNGVESANSQITAVYNSSFIRSRNAFTQAPIVRMITFYYPGEWYPPNDYGNPSGDGAGYAWPANMPWKIAEVVGDYFSDLSYNVTFGNESYLAYPMETDGIGTSSDGTIDRVTMRISNYDNIVTRFVENPYLVGNVTSNSTTGYVNGQLVNGLDPATVVGNIHYNQSIVDTYYGRSNSAWSYDRALARRETWQNLKYDSRDFLGGVVEIKSTLANHLMYWPEYSSISYLESVDANVVQVTNTGPYRVGDTIKTPTSSSTTIQSMLEGNYMLLSGRLNSASTGQPLYIVNQDYDPDAYIKDVFKVTELTALNDMFAEFTLTSWLQYFKLQLPKRKYYKNTCQWEYKGPECQYPGPNGGLIPGSIPPVYANANAITTTNQVGTLAQDECAKSYEACRLRRNTIHFGGFPGTGRQLPRQ